MYFLVFEGEVTNCKTLVDLKEEVRELLDCNSSVSEDDFIVFEGKQYSVHNTRIISIKDITPKEKRAKTDAKKK
ncbi:MAG: hypothetical protein WC346_19205 [Methanogenium sp.]|jgi:hypothetical protein